MPIGYSDLKNVIRLPTPWDAAYLTQWSLKDGTTFAQVVQEIGAGLVVFNRSLLAGYWAQYIRTSTEPKVDDIIGGEGGAELQAVSEYSKPDPIRGDVTGHMLPLKDYGGALGWTSLALRRAIRGRIEQDIRRMIERSDNTWQKRVLERLFQSAAETVGAAGKSVPFADGGTADADYVPPTYEGRTFASTHNHFLRRTDDAAGRILAVKDMALTLYEHGLKSPWELIIPEVDQADWTSLTDASAKFIKPQRAPIATAGVELRGAAEEETYIGLIETDLGFFRVKTEPRLPTNYAGLFKPMGQGSADSPLVCRYEDGYPLGLTLVQETMGAWPLQDAIVLFTFGMGVGNRVAGAATFFAAAGAYTDPTIS